MSVFSDFFDAYLECASWASSHFESAEDPHGTPFDELDALYSDDTLESMRADCVDFMEANAEDLEVYSEQLSYASAGHDFWLTRNGHGTGFWDRGLGGLGDRLSKAAKVYGSSDLYLGNDGEIHVT